MLTSCMVDRFSPLNHFRDSSIHHARCFAFHFFLVMSYRLWCRCRKLNCPWDYSLTVVNIPGGRETTCSFLKSISSSNQESESLCHICRYVIVMTFLHWLRLNRSCQFGIGHGIASRNCLSNLWNDYVKWSTEWGPKFWDRCKHPSGLGFYSDLHTCAYTKISATIAKIVN